MVFDALLDGEPIQASRVDRRTNANLLATQKYECIGCGHELGHRGSVLVTPHFWHTHRGCLTCSECIYYSGDIKEVPKTYEPDDLNNNFVKKWQQNYPHFVENGVLYNLGSSRSAITIYDNIRDNRSKNISSILVPPKVVILNGLRFGIDLVRLDDLGTIWMRPSSKSFIDDMLMRKAIVLLDVGSDHIMRVNLEEKIKYTDYDYDFNKPLYQFYKCDILPMNNIFVDYFPDGYTLGDLQPFNYNVIKIAKNNVERKKKEQEEEALRMKRQYEEKEAEKALILAREKEESEYRERLLLERIERSKLLAMDYQNNYVPRKLKNKEDVLELYKRYISGEYFTNKTIQFAIQKAEDGTEFFDITGGNIIDQHIKCVYDTNLLRNIIRAKVET